MIGTRLTQMKQVEHWGYKGKKVITGLQKMSLSQGAVKKGGIKVKGAT